MQPSWNEIKKNQPNNNKTKKQTNKNPNQNNSKKPKQINQLTNQKKTPPKTTKHIIQSKADKQLGLSLCYLCLQLNHLLEALWKL